MLKRIDMYLEESVLVVSLCFTVILIFIQIVSRYFFAYSPPWTEEITRFIYVWQCWLGASLAVKHGRHLRLFILKGFMSKNILKVIEIIALSLWIVFSIFMVWKGTTLALAVKDHLSPVLRIPMVFPYASVPVGCLLMTFRLYQVFRYNRISEG